MWMKRIMPCLLLPILSVLGGCNAQPDSMAMMVVDEPVSDADVEGRRSELLGRGPEAADAMFGSRVETLVDIRRSGRQLLIYPDQGDRRGASRYVVEVSGGRIRSLTKAKRNIDGVEDTIKKAGLERKLIGESPAKCEFEAGLGSPKAMLHSQDTGQLVRVYDVRNRANLRGARYCVLRFGLNNACESVHLVGVRASTTRDPASGR